MRNLVTQSWKEHEVLSGLVLDLGGIKEIYTMGWGSDGNQFCASGAHRLLPGIPSE